LLAAVVLAVAGRYAVQQQEILQPTDLITQL